MRKISRLVSLFAIGLVAACSGASGKGSSGSQDGGTNGAIGGGIGPGTGTNGGTGTGLGSNGSNGTGGIGTGTGAAPGTQLQILPLSPTLQVTNGTPATLTLKAVLVADGGAQTPVQAYWSGTNAQIATIATATGIVSASGPRGGPVEITALADGLSASTTVAVVVNQTDYVGTSASAASSFSATPTLSATNAPQLIYPYDKTVIPVNLQPINVQWEPGGTNTLFQVQFAGPYSTLTAYVQPSPIDAGVLEPAWQPDLTDWQNFAQSNIGATVKLSVVGTVPGSGAVYATAAQQLTLAASRFAGTIYYWTISGPGAVLQLSPGASAPQTFYSPPLQPNTGYTGGPGGADAGPPDTCIACHAVSPDGTKMSAELWGGGQPGTVLDLTQNPATALFPAGAYVWLFSTIGPTNDLMVTSLSGYLTLRDTQTGAPVPSGSGDGNQNAVGLGPAGLATQPSWSRDGTLLAFMQGVASLPGSFTDDITFTAGDLVVSNWLDSTQSFAPFNVVAAYNFDGNTLANFYPSFSTDDSLLAFTRSTCSYNCDTNDQLMVVSPDGGTPIELANAEGTDLRNRYPNFSPFKEGGYHWMAFFSMRDYGWVTKGQSQRQIWVTAIDDPPSLTSDPSHPAFWLPAQDPTTENNKAQWATLPCAGQGSGCEGDIDCCSGLVCREADGGVSQCVPSAGACALSGSSCTQSSDCCSPFLCQANGTCGVTFQ